MSLFDFFRPKKSAKLAKERLQIVVSHQRKDGDDDEDFLPKLRTELMGVIGKYFNVNAHDVNVNLQKEGNCSILELNVTLPNKEDITIPEPTEVL